MTDKTLLADRVRKLERELFTLRRELIPNEAPPERDFEVLTVKVGGEWFSLVLDNVQEVLPMIWPRPLPDSPAWLLGTFRIDDNVVPVVDLRSRIFATPEKRSMDAKIVLLSKPKPFGFVVDEVGDIETVETDSLTPPSQGISHAPYLLGTYESQAWGTLPLLALERLSGDFAFDQQAV